MAQFTDQWGLTVDEQADGSWLRSDGLHINGVSQSSALATYDAMAPDGWTRPVPTVAQQAAAIETVPAWKVMEVLAQMASPTTSGKTMLDDANTLIATQSIGIQIAWRNGADVSYTSPALAGIKTALGLTDAQFDLMWIASAAVSL